MFEKLSKLYIYSIQCIFINKLMNLSKTVKKSIQYRVRHFENRHKVNKNSSSAEKKVVAVTLNVC